MTRPIHSVVLLGAAAFCSPPPPLLHEAPSPESQWPKETAGMTRTDSHDTTRACHVGRWSDDARHVKLTTLCHSPEEHEGEHVTVEGFVLDLYEMHEIVIPDEDCSIAAEWPQRDIRDCRKKRVLVSGVFRRTRIGEKGEYVLQVNAIRDVSGL